MLLKRVAIIVYPKNSFDRFGDDLTEEILQYLTFEDKIRLDKELSISDRFFISFSEFKTIKKLKIEFANDIEVNASVEAFKHCKQLKDLDISYSKLREDFFTNIELFVPKLQYLGVFTEQDYSDSFIDSVSKNGKHSNS